MPKSRRKKKLKEKGFQKVKFKVGKKVQPPQNATDTSFKSRAIFIPSQLSQTSEPTNQRNQNLKDLLAQVSHYSATSRQDALVGLKDLFHCHENLLHENLGIVIKKVAEKMTDNEPSVRQSLLLFLCSIFPRVPQEKMAPFSPLIIAHLSCAMTHIYDDIQHDSLGFLELCLQCFPSLMVRSSSQLINNFIGMISHQDTLRPQRFNGLKGLPRSILTVNPKGKLSSLRSRLKVLQQLHAFLKAMDSLSNSGSSEMTFASTSNGDVSSAKPVFKFSKLQPTQVQVLQHSVNEPKLPLVSFGNTSFPSSSLKAEIELNILTHEKHTKNLLETIVPLLLECWVECNPTQMTTSLPDNVVSSSAIDVMLAVAETLKIIFTAAQRNQKNSPCTTEGSTVKSLLEIYVKDLSTHVMAFFPFTLNHARIFNKGKRKCGNVSQKAEKEKNDASALVLNLTVCEIMLQFLGTDMTLQSNFRSSSELLKEFVLDHLEIKAKGGIKSQIIQTDHVERLVVFAYKIIVQYCLFPPQAPDQVHELLEAAFLLYQSSHAVSGTKKVLMLFFASLAFHENSAVSRHEEVQRVVHGWLQRLPYLLVQLKDGSPALTEVVLGILMKALTQSLLKADREVSSSLWVLFSKYKGPFRRLTQQVQRLAIELLFHLSSIDSKLLQVLVSCCQGDADVNISVIEYIVQVLYYRSPCYQGYLSYPVAFSFPLFLSALFSIAIGFSQHKLQEFQKTTNHGKTFKFTELKGCSYVILEEKPQQGSTWGLFPIDLRHLLRELAFLVFVQHAEPKDVASSSNQKSPAHKPWDNHQIKLQAVCQCFKQSRQSNDLFKFMISAFETFLKEFKVLPVTAAHSFLFTLKCLVKLSADPESQKLPSQSLSNLAHLSLVCLKHSTVVATYSGDFSSGAADMETNLFEAVVELLLAWKAVANGVLSLLLHVLSDALEELLRQDFAVILTKLLCSKARKVFLQLPDIVKLIVSRILGIYQLLSRNASLISSISFHCSKSIAVQMDDHFKICSFD